MKALIKDGKIHDVVGAEFPVVEGYSWVDVPDDTQAGWDTWDGSAVVKYTAPPATVADVKAEAGRRITSKYPAWKQTNMIAHSTELQEIRIVGGTLTADQQRETIELAAAWAWVRSVREASDAIEADLPMSVSDMEADARWPTLNT